MTDEIARIRSAADRLTNLLSLPIGKRTRGQVSAAAVDLAAAALHVATDVAPKLNPVTDDLCAVIGEADAASDVGW